MEMPKLSKPQQDLLKDALKKSDSIGYRVPYYTKSSTRDILFSAGLITKMWTHTYQEREAIGIKMMDAINQARDLFNTDWNTWGDVHARLSEVVRMRSDRDTQGWYLSDHGIAVAKALIGNPL